MEFGANPILFYQCELCGNVVIMPIKTISKQNHILLIKMYVVNTYENIWCAIVICFMVLKGFSRLFSGYKYSAILSCLNNTWPSRKLLKIICFQARGLQLRRKQGKSVLKPTGNSKHEIRQSLLGNTINKNFN